MEKIAEKIVKFMLEKGTIAEDESIAYKYGLQIGLEVLLNTVVCVIIAIILDAKLECLIFLSVFTCIRAYAGGLHLSTFLGCTLVSSGYLITMLIVMRQYLIPMKVSLVIIWTIMGGIKVIAPVEDSNRKLTMEDKNKFSRRLSYVLYFIFLLSIILYLNQSTYIASAIAISLIGSFIVLLLGKFKNKIQK